MALHVFAYGSLIWRPGFECVGLPFVAEVHGWARRLDQGSPDHRGTPERLGRVATLVETPSAVTRGVVFTVADALADATIEALDLREQGGYDRVTLRARRVELATSGASGALATPSAPAAPDEVDVVTYVARPSNPYFRGAAAFDAMARDVAWARGPSGANLEYVERLARALDELGIDDAHVRALRDAVASIDVEAGPERAARVERADLQVASPSNVSVLP